MEEYNKAYKTNNFFGEKADSLLINHYSKIKAEGKVLDIGIGQGRNSFFLLDKGYKLEGIDPSQVAIDLLEDQIHKQNIKLNVFCTDFSEFHAPANTFDAVLIFGLIQILSEQQIEQLAEKASVWLKKGGLVFLTGFTKQEKTFMPKTSQWKTVSESSFTNDKGDFRTFLNANEAANYFKNFKVVHNWQGAGEVHRHGDGPEEQHHLFELILSLK